jgi:hypothetical protein
LEGKTPEQTVAAQLAVSARRGLKRFMPSKLSHVAWRSDRTKEAMGHAEGLEAQRDAGRGVRPGDGSF